MSLSGAYSITNLLTGQQYIGGTNSFKNRWYVHRSSLRRGVHHAPYLQRSWSKYGEVNFRFVILEECENTKSAIEDCEQKWLDLLHPMFNTYLTACSPVSQKELNARKCGHVSKGENNEAWRLAISIGNSKKRGPNSVARAPISENTKIKMAAAKFGKKRGPHSEEHKEKIASAQRGVPRPTSTKLRDNVSRFMQYLSEDDKLAFYARRAETLRATYTNRKSVSKTYACIGA